MTARRPDPSIRAERMLHWLLHGHRFELPGYGLVCMADDFELCLVRRKESGEEILLQLGMTLRGFVQAAHNLTYEQYTVLAAGCTLREVNRISGP